MLPQDKQLGVPPRDAPQPVHRRAFSAALSLHPITSISARIAHRCAPNARPNAYCTLLSSHTYRHAGRILPAPRLSSRSAPPSNPHSTRCTVGAQLPATSCLGAFWTPVSSACGALLLAGVQKPAQKAT